MDALEINYRLKRAGMNQASIAKQLGVSQSVVGNVIHDRITAYEVASFIAGVLGEELTALWPHRYCFKPRGRAPHRKALPAPTPGPAPQLEDPTHHNNSGG